MISVQERFEKHFHPEPMSGCWLWTGWLNRGGYGTFRITTSHKDPTMQANRASWIIYRGKIPKNKWVLHKCHRALCVNPDHLYLGTHKENMRDMRESGRGNNQTIHADPVLARRGEHSSTAKITNKQALEIRKRRSNGERGSDLAREFKVSNSHISHIYNGRTWKHVGGDL